MKMFDMKNTGKEEMDGMESMAQMPEAPLYPYGLRICLNKDSLKKLGMDKLPELNSEMELSAKVIVVSRSEENEMDGEVCKRMELQIVEMGLSAPASPSKTAAALYGGSED